MNTDTNAAVATDRPEPLKHTFSLTVEVDPFWIKYLTYHIDIFGKQYIGYWARGVAQDDALGWLVAEMDGEERYPRKTECERVEALWRAGKPLPERWYCLDRAAALRAWEEGVKRWGVDWYHQADAEREDVVVQLSLLGEVRYG